MALSKIQSESINLTDNFAGMRFGGTATDNELDDYEEGTFNVGITGSSNRTCKYVKVGRMVTVTMGSGGALQANTYWNDGGRAVNSAVDVLTTSGSGQLPFLPAHNCHGIFMQRSLRCRDGSGPDDNATYVWAADSNSTQLYIGKMSQNQNQYSVIGAIGAGDNQVRLEKGITQSNVALASTFTYYTDS